MGYIDMLDINTRHLYDQLLKRIRSYSNNVIFLLSKKIFFLNEISYFLEISLNFWLTRKLKLLSPISLFY